MQVVFWLATGLLVFHYAGYPLLLGLLAAAKKEKIYPPLKELPSLTLLISVYNEEGVIRERLENCRQLDYPRERLKIVVVSDGSSDGTHAIVQGYGDLGVDLQVISGRVGKTEALNRVIPNLSTDILVFTDANSMLGPDALKQLVRPFADPAVGAVCGELKLVGDAGAEGAYWRYEKAIKAWESRVSTLTVVNGALYGLRRNLHRPMAPMAANDFQHPLQVARQGRKTVYLPSAVAEETAGGEAVEARRRVRIIARGWRGLGANLWVLNPFRAGLFTFQFGARKLLRWLGPLFLLAALAANAVLFPRSLLYQGVLLGQAVFYALALSGAVWPGLRRFSLFNLPFYFCLINWAALQALFRVLAGRDSSVWAPTTSQGSPD